MKALVMDAQSRVFEIKPDDQIFEVAAPLHWVDAPDDVAENWCWDGENLTPPPALAFDQVKLTTLIQVDQMAEAARQLFISAGAGKAMIYLQKVAEAAGVAAVLAASGTPDPAAYPILSAEAPARGLSLEQLAGVVMAKRGDWLLAAGAIEAEAVRLKAEITNAGDLSSIATIMASAAWPSP